MENGVPWRLIPDSLPLVPYYAPRYVTVLNPIPDWLQIDPEIADALSTGSPVVALESAVLTHGLPQPANLENARAMETVIRESGAVPATIAALDGRFHLGLTSDSLKRLAHEQTLDKISLRDLGAVVSQAGSGGTTVAATMFIAHHAAVRVFATGGIGGVHRGGAGDISADLPALATIPVAVVCSGAKAILDLPRTREWLETHAIPVLGWQTDVFPAFFSRDSGLPVDNRVDTANEAAALIQSHWNIGMQSAVLLCVPCPPDAALTNAEVERCLQEAERQARQQGIAGKALTPFLLDHLARISKGATLRANLALLCENARVAALLAQALAQQHEEVKSG